MLLTNDAGGGAVFGGLKSKAKRVTRFTLFYSCILMHYQEIAYLLDVLYYAFGNVTCLLLTKSVPFEWNFTIHKKKLLDSWEAIVQNVFFFSPCA